jgi:hypothetical protein
MPGAPAVLNFSLRLALVLNSCTCAAHSDPTLAKNLPVVPLRSQIADDGLT